jgi:cell wall-associated NlpC family hydrolase
VRRTAALAAIALLAAGCGSSSSGGHAHELNAWTIPDDAFIPDVGRAKPVKAKVAPQPSPKPRPKAPASGAPSDAQIRAELRDVYGAGGTGRRISLAGNGKALAPPDAPDEVQSIVSAANQVARLPYVYGGGHGRQGPEGIWVDSAYDCSGSVSFALASAGLLESPLDSSSLARWGKPGPGRWVTIFANAGHAFMEVGGVRFDTVGLRQSGSRWQPAYRSVRGFTVRHPEGL